MARRCACRCGTMPLSQRVKVALSTPNISAMTEGMRLDPSSVMQKCCHRDGVISVGLAAPVLPFRKRLPST